MRLGDPPRHAGVNASPPPVLILDLENRVWLTPISYPQIG